MNRLQKVALVVLFLGFAAAASAQTLRVTADRTNLRDKATTDGAIVVALSMGEELEVIDQAGTWYHVRVKSSGREGYVSSLVVQVVPGTAPAGAPPAGAASPAPAPTAAPRAAQAPQASQESGTGEGFDVGYLDVGPVIGLGGIGGAGFSIGGRLEKAFMALPNLGNGVLGIGVGVDWYRYDANFVGAGFDYGFSYIPISVTANYHFRLENRKIDPFAGAGLGYQRVSVTGDCVVFGVDVCGDASSSGVYFVVHGGIRYFWRPKLALYADVGAGAASLNVGLMLKLK